MTKVCAINTVTLVQFLPNEMKEGWPDFLSVDRLKRVLGKASIRGYENTEMLMQQTGGGGVNNSLARAFMNRHCVTFQL